VQVGVANSVTKLNFVGAVVNATVSGSISTISLAPSSRVAVGTEPPGSVLNGDLWWSSSVGELYVYYEDGDSNQWVETAGGSETVTISDTAPPDANSGDLWWESDDSRLKVFYNSEWVDTNPWLTNSVGVHTSVNIGIGTTNPTSSLTVKGNTSLETLNVSGVSTFQSDVNVGVDTSTGVILTSPNGTQYRLIVDDSGNLGTVAV
jgi:hypothetical protein